MKEKYLKWHDLIFSNQRGTRFLRHLIFWLVWWLYFAGTYHYYMQVGQQKIEYGGVNGILIIQTIILLVIHIIACYIFVYVLLPHFLTKRNYFVLTAEISMFVVSLVAAGYFIHEILFTYLDPTYHDKLEVTRNTFWWISVNSVLLTSVKIIASASVIVLAKRWYLKQKEEGRILNEKFITDLKLMRAQVRPEFLFSSLDLVYQYSKVKSPGTKDLLLKFSDLLSYLLYECDEAKVPLEKELTMMKEYMTMEKMRFGKSLEMEIDIKGNADHKTIAPLLLLPFIENSFRQCKYVKDQSWINLELSIEGNILTMKLMNGVAPNDEQQELQQVDINNVKKRLQLLYPGDHELKIYQEHEINMTLLKITLIERFVQASKDSVPALNDQVSTNSYAIT